MREVREMHYQRERSFQVDRSKFEAPFRLDATLFADGSVETTEWHMC